ncbi:MAG: hypothetical protein ACQEQA_04665, partial [Bacillota bacterium]
LILVMVLFTGILTGCDESFTYEPFNYKVETMEARFNDQLVLDTSTMDDEEALGILDDVNEYLGDVEIITNADSKTGLDGGHWFLTFTTEDDQTLNFGVSYDQLSDDVRGIPITLDGEEIGHLEDDDYTGLLDAFDADSYVPEY